MLFVDGRYTLQVRQQVDDSIFSVEHLIENPPDRWIEKNLSSSDRSATTLAAHVEGAERLRKGCANAGAALVPIEQNLVDEIWSDRPAPPLGPVSLHDLRFAGETAEHKRERIAAELAKLRADALVISDPHAVAWTFNIRGSGRRAYTPPPLIRHPSKEGRPAIYIDDRKLSNEVRSRLEALADVRAPGDFDQALAVSGTQKRLVRLDQATAADALAHIIKSAGGSACRARSRRFLKSVKNDTEIAGARAAHIRDGAAAMRFLCWFDAEARGGKLTEIEAVEALESFRRDTGLLKDISFPTIAGAGPDRAIVHYRVTTRKPPIAPGELFLINSGGQYEDGTTDITRSVVVGEPTPEIRDRFTLVLKGHVACAHHISRWHDGAQLNSFARRYMWEAE